MSTVTKKTKKKKYHERVHLFEHMLSILNPVRGVTHANQTYYYTPNIENDRLDDG